MGLGPTGRYPQGKLFANDDGELRVGIAKHQGKIIVNFGVSITFLAMTRQEALAFAEALTRQAQGGR